MLLAALRHTLKKARNGALASAVEVAPPSEDSIFESSEIFLSSLRGTATRRAINATGIILHTGLGRAPLSKPVGQALLENIGYSIVEVDRSSGERNKREERLESLFQELTSCEAATVVNNCAAAIFLALAAVAAPGEVIISRGQLVEIGGAFRMPDVMAQSGCILREVGATNRTSLEDYRKAINDRTTAILIVSQSNFRIRGFTASPELHEICELGKERGIPVLYDLGGGALVNLENWGFPHETTVQEAVAAGVSLVCFSGDKLIGGPQAGVLVGKKGFVEKARKHPFFRMFRPDRLALSALEATLVPFFNGEFEQEIPVFQMLCTPKEELQNRAAFLHHHLLAKKSFRCSIIDDLAYLGGGSLPDEALPSPAIRIELQSKDDRKRNRWANNLARSLRLSKPAVFCRIENRGIMLNLRTVFPEELEQLRGTLETLLNTDNAV